MTMVASDPTVALSSKDVPNPAGEKEGKPVKVSSSSGNAPAPPTSEESSKAQEEGSGVMSEGSRKWKVHDVWILST